MREYWKATRLRQSRRGNSCVPQAGSGKTTVIEVIHVIVESPIRSLLAGNSCCAVVVVLCVRGVGLAGPPAGGAAVAAPRGSGFGRDRAQNTTSVQFICILPGPSFSKTLSSPPCACRWTQLPVRYPPTSREQQLLLQVLSSDSLRAVRGFLLDDRWIVLAAGVAPAFARALQAERLGTIERFAYW